MAVTTMTLDEGSAGEEMIPLTDEGVEAAVARYLPQLREEHRGRVHLLTARTLPLLIRESVIMKMDKDEECGGMLPAQRELIVDHCVRTLTPELLDRSAQSANTVSMPVIHSRVSQLFAALKRVRFGPALAEA